jgi:hypothetical protein
MFGLHARAAQPGVVLPAGGRGLPAGGGPGNGALGGLQRYTALNRVDAVVLSHLHADHCLDMCPLWIARKYSDEDSLRPIPVYAPAGAAERIARANDDPDVSGVFDFVTLTPGRHLIGPFAVTAGHVAHPVETFAFRFEHGGHSLTYSGDTGESPALVELAASADVLLCEAGFPDLPDLPPDLHLCARQAGQHAARADAGTADRHPPISGHRPGAEPGRGGGRLQRPGVPRGPRPGSRPVLAGTARDISSQLILTTWPPFLHSCGPRPPAGAMLQFET